MAKKVFNMQGGLHSAAAYAGFENRAYGSCVASSNSFVVTPGAGMNLSISTGDGLISVDAFLARRIQVTATESVAVPAANASFNRIDTVVAYIDTAVAPTTAVVDNINDILMFAVVAGTAAATPVAPTGAAILAAIGAGKPYMVLYDVLVPQGATNVAGVTLTDRRNLAALSLTPAREVELKTTWAVLTETHTFSSFNSATRIGVIGIPSGGTSRFTVGQKYKLTQATGGTKYGFIVAVASTTLSVFFGPGVTLNNEAITAPAFSADYLPTGYTGPMLTKEEYRSNLTYSERWVYEVSGWAGMTGSTGGSNQQTVALPVTFAAIPIVVVAAAGDQSSGGLALGAGGNSVHGLVASKHFQDTVSSFVAYTWTNAGSWTAGNSQYITWTARGPVA